LVHTGNEGAAMLDSNKINDEKHKSSELVIGLVTFIIFIIFMTLWTYLGTAD